MNKTSENKLLGILGGLGPMATAYFYELLTAYTVAKCDQEHIDMVISSKSSTPDRSSYILGLCKDNPLPVMISEAKKLEAYGADVIAIPCNTAHYFYDGLTESCQVPILNIIDETCAHLSRVGVEKFGLLATEGTIRSGAYERFCTPRGLTCVTPNEKEQAIISEIIFGQIKQNKPVDVDAFLSVVNSLRSRGCEKIVLGCTELSLLKKQGLDDEVFVDSLDVLAYRTILACGKTPIGFPASFDLEVAR